jgi:hypothetical protein
VKRSVFWEEQRLRRDKLYPNKIPLKTLTERAGELMQAIGETPQKFDDPDTSYISRSRQVLWFEEALHELAHHLTLDPGSLFDQKRKKSIGGTISDMSPMMAEGNELDALALELNTAWILRVAIHERPLITSAADGNLNFFTRAQALRTVRELRETPMITQLGFDLAHHLTKKL